MRVIISCDSNLQSDIKDFFQLEIRVLKNTLRDLKRVTGVGQSHRSHSRQAADEGPVCHKPKSTFGCKLVMGAMVEARASSSILTGSSGATIICTKIYGRWTAA